MRKNICVLCLIMAAYISFPDLSFSQSVQEKLKKLFPQVRAESVTPTEINGVYEVVSENRIGYFAPEPGYLILGEIIDKNGINITANRRNELVAMRAKNLPLDKALRIGTGKNVIIEFTDPDCPYCRKAAAFLAQKSDVTRYIFFFPLPMHKDAENKTKYIFCSSDKAKAYEEAMQGKLDDQKYEKCAKKEADALLAVHKEAAHSMGINSTPFFIVNGKPVTGANTPEIDKALQQK
jgi:thiol:disulfide interchange protein DsbC